MALISLPLLILLAVHGASQQPPVYHNLAPYSLDGNQTYSFVMKGSYFTSPLNFDAAPGMVVVGGRGMVYLLSSDLTLLQQLSISGPPCGSAVQACPSNLVRLYSAPSANSTTMVVCASTGPLCSLVDTSSGSLTMTTGYVTSSSTLLSSDPNVPSVDIFFNLTSSRNTNLFAVSGTSLTFHTLNPNDPTSLNSSLKFGFTPMNNIFNLTTWFSPLLVIVDVYKADYPMRGPLPPGYPGTPTPDEHKYFFVFVREQDPVTTVVTNKVVRLCQNDPGSVGAPSGLTFPTTLLKANISCQSSSGPMRPNLLQGVVFSRPGRYYAGGVWVELMYATFTDYSGYSPQSSICVYLANDSDALAPNGVNNRGVFDIFRSQVYDPVSGVNVANGYVECTTSGRSDLLSQRINLVQSVAQYNQDPLAILSGVVVTKMAVDQPCVLNGSSCVVQDVLFLGTSTGSVLKMTMSFFNGSIIPVISENLQLGDSGSVRQMGIQTNQQTGVKYLYVNTDNGIYALPLERCGRYLDCSGCVGSRDPYCVWNNVTSQCVVYTSDLNITMVIQNINTGLLGVYCPASTSGPTSVPTTLNPPTKTASSPVLTQASTLGTSTQHSASTTVHVTLATSGVSPWTPMYTQYASQTGPTHEGVATPAQLVTSLGPALGTTLPIIVVLLIVIVILLLIVYQSRNGRHSTQDIDHCESPNSVTPLANVPSKCTDKVVPCTVVPATAPSILAEGKEHLYGQLEERYGIYAPLEVTSKQADTTPHEYSSINM